MRVERHVVHVRTDGAGNGSGQTGPITGRIHSIRYIKHGTNAYADGVDVDVTSLKTGQKIWDQDNVNATVQVAPRQPVHSAAGAALVYAATDAVTDYFVVADERLEVVVANGGANKDGTFEFLTLEG